jgi:hypothetical protein
LPQRSPSRALHAHQTIERLLAEEVGSRPGLESVSCIRRVGELTLRMQAFDVRSAPGQELVVYYAEPDSRSAEALSLLSALVNW